MSKPTVEESLALSRSDALLRFAAENIRDFDEGISLAIARAVESKERGAWSPEMSQMFWTAYGRLSDIVKPVTTETLDAVTPVVRQRAPWLRFLGPDGSSLATRTSSRFLAVLVALLFVVVPIQLYSWTLANLEKDIDTLKTTLASDAGTFSTNDTALMKIPPSKSGYTATQAADIAQLLRAVPTLRANAQEIQGKIEVLRQFRTLSWSETSAAANPATKSVVQWFDVASDVLREVGAAKSAALVEETKASLVVGILLSFVMPILFGTVGALAYVIRTISSQITASTFSPTSPIRHCLRVALGALLGVVVGLFSDLTQRLSLQPLAIAFLAGYGVEAVFSMFDSLIERFKITPSADVPAQATAPATRAPLSAAVPVAARPAKG